MGTSLNIHKIIFFAFFISQICLAFRYPLRTLRCKSGEYIRNTDYCDGTNDCDDNSDEPSNCRTWNCNPGEFSCASNVTANATCKDSKLLCNTKLDCYDGFDESNCAEEVKIQNCKINEGKFLCNDSLRCLDLQYTCDGSCNCFDCSDESDNCTKTGRQSLGTCPHSYFPTPVGPQCFCDPSNDAYNSLCKEIKNCTSPNSCDQHCSQYKNKLLCSCYEDFIEVPVSGGFKCRSKEYYGTKVIYSTSNCIKSLNITTKNVTILKKNVQTRILAGAGENIYYTTFQDNSKTIFKISSHKNSQVIKSDLPIISIAVDYITNNVYLATNKSISVCSENGEICIMLKCCEVAYVVLAPKFGWMFYTKKADSPNDRLIMRSNMDGTDENVFIDGTFRNIALVSVDESFGRLYWLEQNKIYSISLHDYIIDTHSVKSEHILKSLTVFDRIIFYVSERDNRIYQLENLERFVKPLKDDQSGYVYIYNQNVREFRPYNKPWDSNYTLHTDGNATLSITNLIVYNSIRQQGFQMDNPCRHASCSGLCVLRSGSTSSKNRLSSYTCFCKDFVSSNDQHWCEDPSLETDPSTGDIKQEPVSDEDSNFSFMNLIFILIILGVVLGAGYFVYRKYYDGMLYPRQPRDERIFQPSREEL